MRWHTGAVSPSERTTDLSGTRVLARGPKARGAAQHVGLRVGWVADGGTSAEIIEHLDPSFTVADTPAPLERPRAAGKSAADEQPEPEQPPTKPR